MQERIAQWHHLEPAVLVKVAREPHIQAARLDLIAMLHEMCGYSWAAAARFVGTKPDGRTHGRAAALPPARIAELRAFVESDDA